MGIREVRVKSWDSTRRVRFPEMPLAHRFCVGQGIEIGASAHNRFNLPGAVNCAPYSVDIRHPDYADFQMYRDGQVELCGNYAEVDHNAEAHDLPFEDASQDYVMSSHVVEHLPDLIGAFVEWNRVLKPGGIVLMIFPKCNAHHSDVGREITPSEHFMLDYLRGETVETHEIPAGHGRRGHYHVFTLASMLDLLSWCNEHVGLRWDVIKTEETDSKVGNGHTVVCRKHR